MILKSSTGSFKWSAFSWGVFGSESLSALFLLGPPFLPSFLVFLFLDSLLLLLSLVCLPLVYPWTGEISAGPVGLCLKKTRYGVFRLHYQKTGHLSLYQSKRGIYDSAIYFCFPLLTGQKFPLLPSHLNPS